MHQTGVGRYWYHTSTFEHDEVLEERGAQYLYYYYFMIALDFPRSSSLYIEEISSLHLATDIL